MTDTPPDPPSREQFVDRAGLLDMATKLVKNVVFLVGIPLAVIGAVLVYFWEREIEPWLADRITVHISAHEDAWMRQEVVAALANNNPATLQSFETTQAATDLLSEILDLPNSDDMETLFDEAKFKELFLREVLVSVSDEDRVDEILRELHGQQRTDATNIVGKLRRLEGRINEEVDAIYTLELFNRVNSTIVASADGSIEAPRIASIDRRVRTRFYANATQRFTLSADRNPGGEWEFDQFDSRLFLRIGSGEYMAFGEGLVNEDISCEVYRALLNKPSDFVNLTAFWQDPGKLPTQYIVPTQKFELDVIITAKKGQAAC